MDEDCECEILSSASGKNMSLHKCPGQHLAPTVSIMSLSKNILNLAFVGTTTSFGPRRLHTTHCEWPPPADGIGSAILGGDLHG